MTARVLNDLKETIMPKLNETALTLFLTGLTVGQMARVNARRNKVLKALANNPEPFEGWDKTKHHIQPSG